MSVINRMLLELDERHDSTAQHLPGMVRAVPARIPKPAYRRWILLTLCLGLLLLAGYIVWLSSAHWHNKATPAQAPLPKPAISAPQLQLQHSPQLTLRPAPEEGVQAIVVAPHPLPAPVAAAPSKPATKFLLPARDEPRQSNTVEAVEKFLPKEKPEAAIKEGTIVASSPSSIKNIKSISQEQQADFRYREGLSFLAQGRTQEAQTALEDALRIDPKNLSARQALLAQWLAAKRYPQAEQLLQDGLKLKVAVASLATTLASVQLERGDLTAALATVEKYAAPASGSADYHGLHAALLQRASRHAEAVQQFQAALKIESNQANWLMGLGISLQAEKRNAEAEQAYSRALSGKGLSADLQAFVEQRLQQVRPAR